MRSGLKLWPGFPFRRITSAWGVALQAQGVSLVCLEQTAAMEVRVRQALLLLPPTGAQSPDSHQQWLVQSLAELSGREVRRHRRLVVALPPPGCRTGHLLVPMTLEPEALLAEVQLGAAQCLDVDPAQVSFDFGVMPSDLPGQQTVHWLACLRSEVQAWHGHTRAAGWHLPAVEHQAQAARRAFVALHGGLHALQTRAHQDWQFHWPQATRAATDEALDQTLEPVLDTPAWAWLCACGAGLRALS